MILAHCIVYYHIDIQGAYWVEVSPQSDAINCNPYANPNIHEPNIFCMKNVSNITKIE